MCFSIPVNADHSNKNICLLFVLRSVPIVTSVARLQDSAADRDEDSDVPSNTSLHILAALLLPKFGDLSPS